MRAMDCGHEEPIRVFWGGAANDVLLQCQKQLHLNIFSAIWPANGPNIGTDAVALAGGGGGRWGAVVCWWCVVLLLLLPLLLLLLG